MNGYAENAISLSDRLPVVPEEPLGGAAKRMTDVVVAATALALLFPLFVVIVLLLMSVERGPVLFRQKRRGFANGSFDCLKFRTMIVDSQAVLDAHLASDAAAAEEWRASRKLKRDPRVTRLGEFLRRTSLDELPQLWNVIRGDMSLVGPRPIVDAEIPRYRSGFRYYVATRPGITGLWQVSGRSNTSYDRRVAMDCDYVRRWSLARDLRILAQTIPSVLTQRGSC